MNNLQSKSAQNVQDTLTAIGINCQVMELTESTRTAQDAANALGCRVEQIVKSLIFKTETTNKPVLLLVSGPNRVNESIIAQHLGEKIIKADAIFTREVTGYAIGGIPPIAHKQIIQDIFIDHDLLDYDYVWAAAGTPNSVFKIEKINFSDLFQGQVISMRKDN